MLKNHSEMLRSVEIVAKQFIDTVLGFLFTRLQKGVGSSPIFILFNFA
jgi:hypothetical protein